MTIFHYTWCYSIEGENVLLIRCTEKEKGSWEGERSDEPTCLISWHHLHHIFLGPFDHIFTFIAFSLDPFFQLLLGLFYHIFTRPILSYLHLTPLSDFHFHFFSHFHSSPIITFSLGPFYHIFTWPIFITFSLSYLIAIIKKGTGKGTGLMSQAASADITELHFTWYFITNPTPLGSSPN